MRELFEVAELVRLAIEDEKTGVVFYSAVAEKVDNEKLKALFERLTKEEEGHQKRFESMLAGLGNYKPKEEYDGQFKAYLQELADGRAFPDTETAKHIAATIANDIDAVTVSQRFERDTLLLMDSMRDLVPDKDRAIVNELIKEEQGHLISLAEARRIVGK